jgi:signal transduction histidine kinase
MKNAVEVLDEGGEVRISAAVVPGAGKIRVETADTGPGIPDEDLGRLFEPYFSRKRKGGGLGLAIVERVIADHNGTIHAERNAPQGAKFVIELPVKRA